MHNCLNISIKKYLFLYTSKKPIEMTVKDLQSISFSGTFKPRELV